MRFTHIPLHTVVRNNDVVTRKNNNSVAVENNDMLFDIVTRV